MLVLFEQFFLGDLDPANFVVGSNHTVCVDNINDFAESFLFSLETQHTIGWVWPEKTNTNKTDRWKHRYGGRATTGQCSLAIIVMAVQSIVGVLISVRFWLPKLSWSYMKMADIGFDYIDYIIQHVLCYYCRCAMPHVIFIHPILVFL